MHFGSFVDDMISVRVDVRCILVMNWKQDIKDVEIKKLIMCVNGLDYIVQIIPIQTGVQIIQIHTDFQIIHRLIQHSHDNSSLISQSKLLTQLNFIVILVKLDISQRRGID